MQTYVQEDFDRQPWGNRLPDHQDGAADGDQDGCRLLGRRPGCAAC